MDEKQLHKSIDAVSHKVKNPLHAAQLNLEVLRIKLQKISVDRETIAHLEIARKEVQRAQDIILRYFEFLKAEEENG